MEALAKRAVFRNEWKYLISDWEAEHLRARLGAYMEHDKNAVNGTYMIRSLYFDDFWDTAYQEKLMGIEQRQKWRIRIYNCSDARISLERKRKSGSYIYKQSARLSREEFEKILAGDYEFLLHHEKNLCKEFYYECVCRVLRPKVIVDYDREPFVSDNGTVRITLDSAVRAAVGSFDIFDDRLPTMEVLEPGKLVLEVKFTEYLPELYRTVLPLDGQEFTALSKYTLCYEKAFYLTDPLAGIMKNNGRYLK